MLRFSETGRPIGSRHLRIPEDATPAAAWQLVNHMRARGFIVMAPAPSRPPDSGIYPPSAPEAFRARRDIGRAVRSMSGQGEAKGSAALT